MLCPLKTQKTSLRTTVSQRVKYCLLSPSSWYLDLCRVYHLDWTLAFQDTALAVMATSEGFDPTTQAQFVTIEMSKYKAAVAKALEREVKAMDGPKGETGF